MPDDEIDGEDLARAVQQVAQRGHEELLRLGRPLGVLRRRVLVVLDHHREDGREEEREAQRVRHVPPAEVVALRELEVEQRRERELAAAREEEERHDAREHVLRERHRVRSASSPLPPSLVRRRRAAGGHARGVQQRARGRCLRDRDHDVREICLHSLNGKIEIILQKKRK